MSSQATRIHALLTARAYLRSRSWLGHKFGLRTMRRLVAALGRPQRSFKSVLIAGTNGKGSVSAYLDSALRSSTLVVGRYTSPHLSDVRERITVSGRKIGNTDFERLVLEVRDRAEGLIQEGVLDAHPNHFEILTAVAFLYFKRRLVDIAILEVGLGGRLDATNVASPLVSAIVSLDFDHEEILGHTLAAIAREKAGVMRRNRTTIVGPVAPEAERVMVERARAVGARLIPAFAGVRVRHSSEVVRVRTPDHHYPAVKALPGAHQRTNLVVAIRILEALASAGLSVDPRPLVPAMSGAQWPGRLERIPGHPPFLLDGAHNPAGARALAAFLKERRLPHLLVFGAMRDKHLREMTGALYPEARLVIATRVRMTRAATTAQLGVMGRSLGARVIEEPSIPRAVSRAKREARPGETVVVAGSLYLVGAVRKRLVTD